MIGQGVSVAQLAVVVGRDLAWYNLAWRPNTVARWLGGQNPFHERCTMSRFLLAVLVVACLVMALPTGSRAADDSDALQGVWVAQSMESEGKAAPAAAVKKMRFTFKKDKLLIKGNFDDDREEECTWKVDPKKTPKQLDFTPPKEKKAILGIYKLRGDELTICLRHASSDKGRPTEFATKADTQLVLIVLKKQKP
jgi:uncharacterized protein (TIGR03067 family)